jgi:hypothetical protein
MVDPLKIIEDARSKHHINIETSIETIELVRYALMIGYNEGYKDRKEFEDLNDKEN